MRILLLNQYVPPDPSPTARLLGEVAEALGQNGHEAVLVGNRSTYRGKKTLFGSRMLREMSALIQLLVRGWFVRRCDAVVCLTSPPLLAVVGRIVRWRHGRSAPLIHWAMDVYPDIAVALGEVPTDSHIHRLSSFLMKGAYHACDRIIALDEDMAARFEDIDTEVTIQRPWPPSVDIPISDHHPEEKETPISLLYSGNLGLAHEWQTLLQAQKILEEAGANVDLIFQGGGPQRDAAKRTAQKMGLSRCRWLPYADEDDLLPSLLSADYLIATQRPETKGCLWPSKLALAVLTDRPILWVGPEGGSIANWLRRQGHACFGIGKAESLANHIVKEGTPSSLSGKTHLRNRIDRARRKGIDRVARLIVHQGPDRSESANAPLVTHPLIPLGSHSSLSPLTEADRKPTKQANHLTQEYK